MKRLEYVQMFDGKKVPIEKEDVALQCEVEVLCMDGVEIYHPVKGKYPWDQSQGVAEALENKNVFIRLLLDDNGFILRWHFDHMKNNPQPNLYKAGWYRWKGDELIPSSEGEYQEEVKKKLKDIDLTYTMLEATIHSWHEYFAKIECIPVGVFNNWSNGIIDTMMTFWGHDMLTSKEVDSLNELVNCIRDELT